jgi:hypothetical protein
MLKLATSQKSADLCICGAQATIKVQLWMIHNLRYAGLEVELLDVTDRRLVAEAAGDLWSKSADSTAMTGRLVVEVG